MRVILEINKYCKSFLFNVGGVTCINKNGVIEGKNNSVTDVRGAYNSADLIVGIGRSALTAMAMGIPTLVYDHFGYVGFIDSPEKFKEAQFTNFSGRILGKNIGDFSDLKAYKIIKEYSKLNPQWIKELSSIVKAEYDADLIANKYLEIYAE